MLLGRRKEPNVLEEENCRIMWHAIKTKASGYGTAWWTREKCQREINSMEHAQNQRVASRKDGRLLRWTIDERKPGHAAR